MVATITMQLEQLMNSYDIIKYNRKEKNFIIIDRNRTLIYDSRVGFLDFQALSLKDKLESDEIY